MQSERVTQIAWAPNLCYCTRGGGTSEKLESVYSIQNIVYVINNDYQIIP